MSTSGNARAGRRAGASTTREDILAAARGLFAERGYDKTTIRAIAGRAGVNPALVHHYFGSKEQVFAAVLEFPADPAALRARLLDGPREEFGRRVLTELLTVWTDPSGRESGLALVRAAMTNPVAAAMLRQFVERVLLDQVAEALGADRLRVSAAVAQALGLMVLRYGVGVEPLASAEIPELVELIAPVVQAYVDG
ncbi:TetR/AcrR family transcriptional regulator [Phaeacidiphilus oryzae]|jgi:AcrR family transcriptional regulator|uniref:TetR/AcrR family transcriptional regulator n=1 Tax=Phaeacidiphilus oryzae TaxID=348818 RepID=UPI00055E74D5|nr:TetR family transcriptional regulator [Phaeacidiphilus oryzae]